MISFPSVEQRLRMPSASKYRKCSPPALLVIEEEERRGFGFIFPNRTWPNVIVDEAPIWVSVDLRDGNQALKNPMKPVQKLELFQLLKAIGFREIEVGFPAASDTDLAFVRKVVEDKGLSSGVDIQVLTQAREELIDKTVKALVGAKQGTIIHFYNSTSPAQRRVVFGMSKKQIINVALKGVKWIKERVQGNGWRLEYSPESFSATETKFAAQVCRRVMDVWEPSQDSPLILNLPDTVQVASPSVYADQVELFIREMKLGKDRNKVVISLHTHNDRLNGVACTELGLQAGADRVEGTLFGNGERTGNVDLVTVALNMYSLGIDPKLHLGDIDYIREVFEKTTGMTVPLRHPYAGELVFTAFSGSHQDAIKKGLAERRTKAGRKLYWDVPYLHMDPRDIGRDYHEVIRVNSQSGKAGWAVQMERYGINMPPQMAVEFGKTMKAYADRVGEEIPAEVVRQEFEREYLEQKFPLELIGWHYPVGRESKGIGRLTISVRGKPYKVEGSGKGPVAACCDALSRLGVPSFQVSDYTEQAVKGSGLKLDGDTTGKKTGQDADAMAYIQVRMAKTEVWGAGLDQSIEIAAIKALISAVNRALIANAPKRSAKASAGSATDSPGMSLKKD